MEGTTYETNVGLLEMPALKNKRQIAEDNESFLKDEKTAIVFLDLVTSGFDMNCEILQIAMKCGQLEFNKYIYPRRCISSQSSQVHNITFQEGNLFVHNQQVEALPKQIVLQDLLLYLKSFKKPCTLVAHNSSFNMRQLIHFIQETFLLDEIKAVITGFTDILTLFRTKYPLRKSKKQLTLSILAHDTLSFHVEHVYNASYNVVLLEALSNFHFNNQELRANSIAFEVIEKH